MGLLGVQAVVSLITLSFLQKICPIYSFGRWLLTRQNIVRYLYPTDVELKKLTGYGQKEQNVKKKRGGYKEQNGGAGDGSFMVPRSIELSLSSAPISLIDVLPLRFYADFVFLLDFSFCTTIVVGATYIHEHYVSPADNEYGISSLWCLLLILFSMRPLLSIVSSYKITQNSGEIVMCIIFGFFFLISAMIILIINDKTLEFHIVPAHKQFVDSANEFLTRHQLEAVGPGSLVTFRVVLAVLSGFVGSLLIFPGLRLAKCHIDSLAMFKERPMMQVVSYTDILYPLFLLALWVPPISRLRLVGKTIPGTNLEISDVHFDVFREALIALFILSRLFLLRYRLQAYLNTACTKLDGMRKEAGKISNREIQGSVTQVFQYLCVVTLQIIVPVILVTALLLMSASLSNANVPDTIDQSAVNSTEGTTPDDDVVQSVKQHIEGFTISLSELRSVFSAHLLQCILSYFMWFTLYACTVTSFFGMFYYTYLVRS